nr:peptidase domain-containing ABC transporter [uncultured Cellulosilyticum sp.]
MKYNCIKQHDITDCGAACLATICKQYGFKTPITKIREVAGTDKQGTNAFGVIKAAEQLGFSAKGVKGNQEAFFSEFPLPAIAHVVVDGMLLHYVVIHKITKKEVIIADPAKGIVKYTPDEFFKIWTGVLILLVPNQNFKKGKETKGLFERFFHLLLPQKGLLIQVFLASLIYTALGILGAFYMKALLDDILPYGLMKTLHVLSLGVIGLYILQTILSGFRSHLLLYLSQKLDIALLLGYYEHVLKLPMSFFGTRRVGEIISRFQDAGHVRDAISGATLTIMIDTLMVIGGGIILYMQDGLLFGVAFIIVLLYAVIVFAFNKSLKKGNQRQMEENAQLTSYLVESLNGIQTVKAFNAERKVNLETEGKFIKLLRSIFKLALTTNVQGILKNLVELIGGVVILWVGAYQVLQGNMSVGSLITFNSLLAYFLTPMKNLINLQPELQTAMVAAERLGEILDLELECDENEEKKMQPEKFEGAVSLRNVDFRYGTRNLVLKHINMEIKKGERIALVGESGCGKTTLVKLLLNFYPIEKGDILIDGNNILDIKKEALREHIAYVPQETFLFSGTILENLLLGTEDIGMEEVVEAAKMARAHEFINELPLRYNTHLEENGANLSGGQRQRLAITRAILKKPDILILDEATSNLDSITEAAIENTINTFSKGMTTIIIAHRLSTIKRCDRIFVMDKGEIIEEGSHEELMKAEKRYYELWQQQLPSLEIEDRKVRS